MRCDRRHAVLPSGALALGLAMLAGLVEAVALMRARLFRDARKSTR